VDGKRQLSEKMPDTQRGGFAQAGVWLVGKVVGKINLCASWQVQCPPACGKPPTRCRQCRESVVDNVPRPEKKVYLESVVENKILFLNFRIMM
jgi:hypothetical protein